MKKWWKKLNVLLPYLFAGCTVGPNYQAPENCIEDTWITSKNNESVSINNPITQWWEVFEDPLLSKYITLAAEYNYDILTATSNIFQARALRQVVASSFWPQIGADVNATKTYFSKNGPIFAIGPSTGTIPGTVSSATGLPFTAQVPQIQNLFNALFDVSWEIDLFGKTRRAVEAADAMIGSTIEQRNDTLISVLAEVARNYVELRSMQQKERLINGNIELLEKKSALIHKQFEAGYVSRLEVENVLAALSDEKAKIPDIQAQIYQNIYILSILIGTVPETLVCELLPFHPLPQAPPTIAIGLKSDLLRRRPDIRRAERELAAETANIGVAVASFFPTFTLLGDAGLQSLALKKLFSWNSRTWAFGADFNIPVFQGGRLKGNLKAQCAQADASLYSYQQIILNALEETESILIAYTQSLQTANDKKNATDRYLNLVLLSRERNCKGLINLLDVLDTERNLNAAEQSQLDSATAILLNLISLYKALGGSCESEI